MIEKVKEKTECIIDEMLEEGITPDNIDMFGKVIDIHKDVANEEYWKTKEEFMMYRGYGNYPSMNYGNRYNERGYNGNRGYGRRYQGHEMIDDMSQQYGTYMDGRNSGNYNGPETTKALEYMLESMVDFVDMLKQDAGSQEEMDIIAEYVHRLNSSINR